MAKLLVVEDDADLASLIEMFLTAGGHDVRVAHDGEEDLKLLHAEMLPDTIIMDVEMPVLDGPGMAYRMFVEDAGKEKIPLVIVSGAPRLGDIAERVGTPYVLSKPFDPVDLVGIVNKALSERRPPRPQTPRAAPR